MRILFVKFGDSPVVLKCYFNFSDKYQGNESYVCVLRNGYISI